MNKNLAQAFVTFSFSLYMASLFALQRVLVSRHKVTLATDSNRRAMKAMGSKPLILHQGITV